MLRAMRLIDSRALASNIWSPSRASRSWGDAPASVLELGRCPRAHGQPISTALDRFPVGRRAGEYSPIVDEQPADRTAIEIGEIEENHLRVSGANVEEAQR